ncbi:hypothetical protein C4N23_08805 [Faecalibacterium hattorii]|uniref:Uncharacterized protein n=1 Tax=Faecalibacterium hattorii TaxID=2935520 RepID=A0A329UH98_9FIRM|nr:hypothetical protein C4N23_08805 [Faecalibacterium hattorii]
MFLLTVSGGSDSSQNKKRRPAQDGALPPLPRTKPRPFSPLRSTKRHLLPGKKGERSCFLLLLFRS